MAAMPIKLSPQLPGSEHKINQGFRSDLYQGTSLLVPITFQNQLGFGPWRAHGESEKDFSRTVQPCRKAYRENVICKAASS